MIMLWLASSTGINFLKPSAEMPPVKIISNPANKINSAVKIVWQTTWNGCWPITFYWDETFRKMSNKQEPGMHLHPYQVSDNRLNKVSVLWTPHYPFCPLTNMYSPRQSFNWKLKLNLSLSPTWHVFFVCFLWLIVGHDITHDFPAESCQDIGHRVKQLIHHVADKIAWH